MGRVRTTLTIAAVVACVGFGTGFHHFLQYLDASPPADAPPADGIVALTGNEERILVGLGLLDGGRGQRLLITGVNELHRTPEQLLRRLGEGAGAKRCCVDIGHGATNTIGNAVEAAVWARKWGFRRILVVTSSHHMPRSLAEFQRTLPEVALIAHPVPSRYLRLPRWWSDRTSARIVMVEYVKYVLATARIQAAWMVNALEPEKFARKPTNAPG